MLEIEESPFKDLSKEELDKEFLDQILFSRNTSFIGSKEATRYMNIINLLKDEFRKRGLTTPKAPLVGKKYE